MQLVSEFFDLVRKRYISLKLYELNINGFTTFILNFKPTSFSGRWICVEANQGRKLMFFPMRIFFFFFFPDRETHPSSRANPNGRPPKRQLDDDQKVPSPPPSRAPPTAPVASNSAPPSSQKSNTNGRWTRLNCFAHSRRNPIIPVQLWSPRFTLYFLSWSFVESMHGYEDF